VTQLIDPADPRLEHLPEWTTEALLDGGGPGATHVVKAMMQAGLGKQDIVDLMVRANGKLSDKPLSPADAEAIIKRARYITPKTELERKGYVLAARWFIKIYSPTLLYHNGDWLEYRNGAYRELEDDAVAAKVQRFLENSVVKVKQGEAWVHEDYNPNSHDVQEVLGAIKRQRHLERDAMSPPCWLSDDDRLPNPNECISFPNCILHVPTGKVIAPTPAFFTRNALEFDYEPKAPEPLVLLQTLKQYWPPEVAETPASAQSQLQEIAGYLLMPDTSQQKIFFLLGPTRSGKGTIARVFRWLLGESNVAAPSMHSLGGEFGRAPLIGKTAAIISETAFGRNDDRVAITGHLKAISGEDKVEINRKNSSFWVGTLLVRFIMLANKIPNFADDSSAFATRLVALTMTRSFAGEEDPGLANKLKAELPGILNWALAGWHRLTARGHFLETDEGREAKADIIRAASPTRSFVDDCGVLDEAATVTEDALYTAYKDWCASNRASADRKTDFGASLQAAFPEIRSYRAKVEGPASVKRPRSWRGIRLVTDEERPPEATQVEAPF
jgi:putative DNA primase/helicase